MFQDFTPDPQPKKKGPGRPRGSVKKTVVASDSEDSESKSESSESEQSEEDEEEVKKPSKRGRKPSLAKTDKAPTKKGMLILLISVIPSYPLGHSAVFTGSRCFYFLCTHCHSRLCKVDVSQNAVSLYSFSFSCSSIVPVFCFMCSLFTHSPHILYDAVCSK